MRFRLWFARNTDSGYTTEGYVLTSEIEVEQYGADSVRVILEAEEGQPYGDFRKVHLRMSRSAAKTLSGLLGPVADGSAKKAKAAIDGD